MEKRVRSAQDIQFTIFFLEKFPVLKKQRTLFDFYNKNMFTCEFHGFFIKNDSGNKLESGEFRFENSLKIVID